MSYRNWCKYVLLILQINTVRSLTSDKIILENIAFDKDWDGTPDTSCLFRNSALSVGTTCTIESPYYNISSAKYIYFKFKIFASPQNELRTMKLSTYFKKDDGNPKPGPEMFITEAENKPINAFRTTEINLDFGVPDDFGVNDGNSLKFTFSVKNQNSLLLNYVETYYYRLKEQYSELSTFKATSAPDKKKDTEDILGTCIANANFSDIASRPVIRLKYDGTYTISGKCECAAGYRRSNDTCQECPEGEFKNNIGNGNCTKCGNNTIRTMKNKCPCIEGSFPTLIQSTLSHDCYIPPSSPTNFTIINKSSTSVSISWKVKNLGSNILGNYKITCSSCDASNAFEISSTKDSVVITELEAYAPYTISVVKENNITELTGIKNSSPFNFRTSEGAPGLIENVRMETLLDGDVIFNWTAPFARGASILKYNIEFGGKMQQIDETFFRITPTENSVTYDVKITAVAIINGKDVPSKDSHSEKVRIKGVLIINQNEDSGPSKSLLGGVTAGAALFVIILLTIIAILFKRQRKPRHLQIYRMEDGSVELCKGQNFSKDRIYVDPTTYSELDYVVYEFTQELSSKDLEVGRLLGSGEFAEVYRGVLIKVGKPYDVAIKKLKYNATKKDRDDFISEAAILGQFNDPNVVHLEGIILKEVPNVLVLELMANGSLDIFLQKNIKKFSATKLLGMARGVASGMKYLSELGYIHRDLAARNILVDSQEICKIADFGMSRELKVDETYSTRGGKIPIKWTAPEAIQYKKFTTGSDAWSYGIVLWEIMSYGERPYWEWPNFEVIERLATGYRLPPPMGCPKVVHDMMLICWHKDRVKRPRFDVILEQIEGWIKDGSLLAECENSVITKSDENVDYSILMGSLLTWLKAIKMDQYSDVFLDHGYTSPKHILHFTLADLEEIGIGPIGHQKKILKAIKTSKVQVEGRKRTVSRSSSTIGYAKSTIGRKISNIGVNIACSLPSKSNHSPILEKSMTLETIVGT